MANKLLKGTFLLSSASFISKILGFIYIVPLTVLIGTSGYALYRYAYGPYTIMLSLSTMGIPLAISKLTAKYKQLEREDIVRKIVKSGMAFMFVTGMTSFLLLYMLAPLLAGIVVDEKSDGNTLESVTYVIRVVSFALIIIPPMSLLRGFFQGNDSMGPPAISTVVEQLSRVLFILAGVVVSLKLLDLSIKHAVGVAAFGAFIGGIAGLAVLLFYFWKRKNFLLKSRNEVVIQTDISVISIFKEIITYSIPFVIMGLSLPLYQNIDTYSINFVLSNYGYDGVDPESVNSIIGLAQILVLIPVSITTGLSVTIIPNITKSFVQNNFGLLREQMGQSLLILTFIIIPAATGICILAEPLYLLLFTEKNLPVLGGELLKVYAPAAILIAFYGVTSSILQAINQQKKLIIGLFSGILIKFILNFMLPGIFLEKGFIIATYCGYLVSLTFNMIIIRERIGIDLIKVNYRVVTVIISTFIMAFFVNILENALSQHAGTFLVVFLCSSLGILIYFTSLYGMNFIRFKKFLKGQ
ncbi:putative polysaccharide biosynthesis protein [Cytobacillus massiliigabonensis]|uniref:putative polysaccharide biosynthesis protein n=1 Tax=Cytobacillus massiliigabonensis TaxID=1871011 RepID=UPI000C85AEE8|nr:polysaccharide biosynthesis protein [Cytobacillus massiliigabonensis]